MAFSIPTRFIIVWTVLVVVTYFVVPRTRIQWVSNAQSLPMTQLEFDSLMLQLPENQRSSVETVGASYRLFEGASIRFILEPAEVHGSMDSLPTCIKVILDQKLCLFFYPDSTKRGSWTFDGFEAGDYENPFDGELRFDVIDRDPW